MNLNLWFVISAVALSAMNAALCWSEELLQPLPRCDQFLSHIFGNQVQVFDPRVYEEIEKYPIKKLARQLKEQNIPLDF